MFFYNPNITEMDEYNRRKEAQIKFIELYNKKLPKEDKIEFIEGEYLPEEFYMRPEALRQSRREAQDAQNVSGCVLKELRRQRSVQVTPYSALL